MPPRKQRLWVCQELDMKENQVYKWFWESQQKDYNGEEVSLMPRHISELSDKQKFEVFVNK